MGRVAGGTNTYSKAPSQFPANAPHYFVVGQGSHIWGDNGREYIDYTLGLGAISLGYADADWLEAVTRAAQKGTIFGLPHPIEEEFAAELAPLLSWPDAQMRYGKNGSDVTEAALRAARAITGRWTAYSVGYHGWLSFCPNRTGLLPATVDGIFVIPPSAPITDELLGHNLVAACCIVEPDLYPDLVALRETCDRWGMLLIFDEVLTGFRTPGFTYANYAGVVPDMICLAKAIGNGSPISVLAGPERHMRVFDGEVGYSTTFGGETTSLAGGLATIRKMKREPVIRRMHDLGDRLRTAWNEGVVSRGLEMPLTGSSSRMVIRYPSLAHRTLVSQEFFARGISLTVGFTLCYAHSNEDIERTVEAISEVLGVVASTDDPAKLVEGPIVSHPFRSMTG